MSKPTPQQQMASSPSQSVWVSASAGTGKTRVLVNRMLRLMLAGSAPEKLLCITFTKAAAAEVLQRIQEVVLTWSVCDMPALKAELEDVLDIAPTPAEIQRARRLLPVILQAAGGMKIMTIHAFCQSVLARFPLEAKVSPGFTVIDEAQSHHLLNDAKYMLLDETDEATDPGLFADLSRFFDRVHETTQNTLIQNVLLKRYRLMAFLDNPDAPLEDIRTRLCAVIGINPEMLDSDLEKEFRNAIPVDTVRSVIPEMMRGNGSTPGKNAETLQNFIDAANAPLDDYIHIFLTKSFTIVARLLSGLDKAPEFVRTFLNNEAQRCFNYIELRHKIDLVKDSYALLHICLKIMRHYQKLKHQHGVLDYEDQILRTAELLRDPLDSQWVHYKLDGGIDHILVDEAQDTSPAQWQIIKGITEEFFAGQGRTEPGTRTLFVVGDEKQSIFSFQNADPVEFSAARRFFAEKSQQNSTPWQDISLIDNFRSAPLILKITDQVFSTPDMAAYITHGETSIEHHGFHNTRPGKVDIWPLTEQPETETPSYIETAEFRLADSIAAQVKQWLDEKRVLSSGKIMRPGDVMILVRTRHPLVTPLTKAFKDRNIPVTSADRLVLGEQLAVQDCLAAMQSCLNPQDNYALSCFLKSPFIGMSEADLFALCNGRESTVWNALLASAHQDVVQYIQKISGEIGTVSPAHFIHALLSLPCPANKRNGRYALITRLGYDCDDILDELLTTAYAFQDDDNASCQNFITYMTNDATTIKRANSEMDNSRVQIMTVHASKGLQAPIVFLADANAKPGHYKNTREVLWQEKFENGFLWGTGDAQKVTVFQDAKAAYIKAQFSEYYRLLYVGLTRAEEQLVICGINKKTESHKDYPSWYDCSLRAATELRQNPAYESNEDNGISLHQRGAIKTAGEDKKATAINRTIPAELLAMPQPELKRIRPLRPSRPVENEPHVFSPLQQRTGPDPYKRGQILHTLFRLIPDYPVEEQEIVLDNLLAHYIDDEREQARLKKEVLNVLRDVNFAHLFSPEAKSEVPVVGEVDIDGQHFAISGQIDRLLVEADRVLIVDYKTNRPPVLDETQIPAAYRHQLRAYKLLMQKIYPGRKVETALLWTALPYLLPVSS